MHLQQTKASSRRTGGPQYYFHNITPDIKDFLRRKGIYPVVLQTPYGIASSPFIAVDRNKKLTPSGNVVPGKVGHDRIQQNRADMSIGEAIRRWYDLPAAADFKRIDIEVNIHSEGHFILAPLKVWLRGRSRSIELEKPSFPLSFNRRHVSSLWQQQLRALQINQSVCLEWACKQIKAICDDHGVAHGTNLHEADILRAGGALAVLGMHLGGYRTLGYDCPKSVFQLLAFPCYECPVEIKKHSRGFQYQISRYIKLPRVVILCLDHDLKNTPDHVDVVELNYVHTYLRRPILV